MSYLLFQAAFSFEPVVKDCVHRLTQSGLKSIDYASGKSYQLVEVAGWLLELKCHMIKGSKLYT